MVSNKCLASPQVFKMVFSLLDSEKLTGIDPSVRLSTRELVHCFELGIVDFVEKVLKSYALFGYTRSFVDRKKRLNHFELLMNLCD